MLDELINSIENLYLDGKHNKIILIQKVIKGFLVRKNNRKLKDNFTFEIIDLLLDKYNEKIQFNIEINNKLKNKKLRNENFPSEISENIVKFALLKKYKICPNWDTSSGDLELLNKKLEVKGFMSEGPSSFGPSEKWNYIYFVDCKKHFNKFFIVYEIKLSNDHNIWKNLKINSSQTFSDQCLQKRRPRITFDQIYKQIPDYCKIIFNGYLSELDYRI